jgi:hypothetical protein
MQQTFPWGGGECHTLINILFLYSGNKNGKNPLWKFVLKTNCRKKRGGPIIVHGGASRVQLFMKVTNRVVADLVGAFDASSCRSL